MTLIGQHFERRARRRELLLTKAIELAVRRSDISAEINKQIPVPVLAMDEAHMTAEYYQEFDRLIDTGKPPKHWHGKRSKSDP